LAETNRQMIETRREQGIWLLIFQRLFLAQGHLSWNPSTMESVPPVSAPALSAKTAQSVTCMTSTIAEEEPEEIAEEMS
jgi:hypothetical protein